MSGPVEPREEGARGAPDLAGAVDSAGAVAGGVAGVISPRMSARSMWTRLGRSLLPRAWWPGAIFQKEMRVQGRRYFTYLTRGVTALLLAGITALIFMAMVDFGFNGASYSGGTAMRLQELQGLAPGVSVTVFLIQLIGMTLAAPILLGPSLCDEKRAGTLSALLTTPLSAWQIVFGKLLSAFSQLTILALIPMPLVLAVRVFGGVPAEFVFAGLSVSYSMAFLCGSLAIFYSTGSKRGLTAATLAALTAIALHAFPALMMAKLISWGVKVWPGMPVLMSTPATTAIMIADLFSGGPTGPWSVRSVWVANSVVNTGLGALTLVFATARVRALLRREGEGTTAAAETGAGAGKTKGGGKERSGSREVGARPVMWRELRQRMFRRRFWAVAATAVASTFLVLVNWDDLTSRGPAMAVTIGGTALALLLATAGSAGSVNGEREARTWDVLLTTGVSAWEVVLGKWTGSMKRLMFVPLVILVQQVVSVGAGRLSAPGIVVHAVILLPAIGFLSATGLWLSMVFRRPTTAAVFNLAIALGLWGVLPALAGLTGMFLERLRMHGTADWPLRGVLAANPVFMAGSNVEGFMSSDGWGGQFALGPGASVGMVSWVAIAVLVTGGGYALATLGVLTGIVARFNRLAGRAA